MHFSTEPFYGKTIFDACAALLEQLTLKSSKIVIASFAAKIISPIVQHEYPYLNMCCLKNNVSNKIQHS